VSPLPDTRSSAVSPAARGCLLLVGYSAARLMAASEVSAGEQDVLKKSCLRKRINREVPPASKYPSHFWRGLFATAMLLLAAAARGETTPEYQIKAVFLFNFAQFVDWPPEALADVSAPLVIGVLGEDPFGTALDDTVRNETIKSRKLIVQRYQGIEDVQACHILFISRSEASRLDQIVAALRGRSILTVSDITGSALQGVMIRFITEKNRIRLRVNLEAAKAVHLVLSSKLLRPAEIVTTQKN
jgi:hypothetical protein